VGHETSDVTKHIKHYILQQWQKHYDDIKTGAAYKCLIPNVSKSIKYSNKQRSKEVMITRLRLGRCRLASYLHAIGCHSDGLCNVCNVKETVSHLLFD